MRRMRQQLHNSTIFDWLDSILARQTPDDEKRANADFVVDTGADLSTTESQVRDILACLGVTGTR